MRPFRAGIVAAAIFGGLVIAGCGGDDSDNNGSGGGDSTETVDLTVHALDLKFDKDSYTLMAGTRVIEMINDGEAPHTLLFDDSDIDFKTLDTPSNGKTDKGSVELEPGTYTIYCDVPGHRAAGMEATIVVN